jgi:hypothetical protein
MSLQSIDARISKIEQRVAPVSTGEVHAIYEADPVIGHRKVAELRATLPENDSIILVTSLLPNPTKGA